MSRRAVNSVLDRVDQVARVVRDGAQESEHLGRLAPAVFSALYDAELFRILVPVELDGIGLTLPESIEVVERVASFDAATGWTLAILGDGPLLARSLARDVFEQVCADPTGLIAGTLNPATARAEQLDQGYVFSGKATYLSGSAHAKWVLAAAVMTREGKPVFGEMGIEIRSGLFPIERAQSLDNWHVSGMRATGSSDHAFDGVEVAEPWTFAPLRARPAIRSDAFEWIPLWSQLGGGLTAVAVGAARNMLDRFVELAATKVPVGGNMARLAERGVAQLAVGEAHGLYQAARALLMQTVNSAWVRGEARGVFDQQVLATQRLGYVTAVRLAARSIDVLHDAAGMSAVASDSVLDRCWRDVHTMTQHTMLSPARFEIAGRVLLGLDPGAPVI